MLWSLFPPHGNYFQSVKERVGFARASFPFCRKHRMPGAAIVFKGIDNCYLQAFRKFWCKATLGTAAQNTFLNKLRWKCCYYWQQPSYTSREISVELKIGIFGVSRLEKHIILDRLGTKCKILHVSSPILEPDTCDTVSSNNNRKF